MCIRDSFKAANGVGPKLAQRIVLELKDKVAKGFVDGISLEDVAGAASVSYTHLSSAAPCGAGTLSISLRTPIWPAKWPLPTFGASRKTALP